MTSLPTPPHDPAPLRGRPRHAADCDDPASLRVRPLGPADEPLLDELHAGLSPRSRLQRFHAAKPTLSRRERAYLAATDGRDHVALVALDCGGAPVGVARYVRLRGEPATAEIAAEVVDGWQRRGVGGDLLGRLARSAAAAGVGRFTATVLSETALRRTLTRRGWRVTGADGPTTTLAVDVWALLAQPLVTSRRTKFASAANSAGAA